MLREALAGVVVIAILNQTSIAANFSTYFPLTPGTHGTKTFEWTYGNSGTLISTIGEDETVFYGNGTTITGTYISNFSDFGDLLASDMGTGIQILGNRDEYLAEDPNMENPPAAWFWGEFQDGYLLDQGTTYIIPKSDPNDPKTDSDQSFLFDLQPGPVTVIAGGYEDALVLWCLDEKYAYATPDFGGKQDHLGIVFPTSAEASDHSVTGFDIYAPGVGLIASGDVDAETGNLNTLCELVLDPATLVGDTNKDGVVDAADYVALKRNFGITGGAMLGQGDLNSDGDVNWLDLQLLMANFGAGGGAPAMAPEPATLFVMVAAGLPALLKRRRRVRS